MISPVGFYRELNTSGSKGEHYASSIYDALRDAPSSEEEKIVHYLRSGHIVFDIMESCRDVIGGVEALAGCSSVCTDGLWVWRQDLAFYVQRYHLELPIEFAHHSARNQYVVPAVPREDMMQIAEEVVSLV